MNDFIQRRYLTIDLQCYTVKLADEEIDSVSYQGRVLSPRLKKEGLLSVR